MRKLASGVSTGQIDAAVSRALDAGASGAKLTGDPQNLLLTGRARDRSRLQCVRRGREIHPRHRLAGEKICQPGSQRG